MKYLSFLVAILVIVGFLISNNQADTSECRGGDQFPGLNCLHFTQNPGDFRLPDPDCCEVARKVDMICYCKNVNRDQQIILSMEKVVYVAAQCGNPVPPGTKCGSYPVPFPPPPSVTLPPPPSVPLSPPPSVTLPPPPSVPLSPPPSVTLPPPPSVTLSPPPPDTLAPPPSSRRMLDKANDKA